MPDTATYDLHATLLRKERMLVESLAGLKEVVKHKGGRGSVGEGEWRQVIDNFLSSRYQAAGNTEVIDYTGQTTEQQDIVVYDQHFCPLFFEEGGITKVPAESVYAVFEVKPEDHPARAGRAGVRSHEGYEWLYVLSGHLRLILAEHDITMGPGEVAEFDTKLPHWFGPADGEPVEILSLLGRDGERIHVRAQPRRKTKTA